VDFDSVMGMIPRQPGPSPFEIACERIEAALKSGGVDLDLSALGLESCPDGLAQLTQLQSLDLRGNELSALPDGLAQLTQLQFLFLSFNQLSALPVGLAQLTQLQYLDLSGNELSALPDGLAQLTQLQSLFLSFNQLSALPDGLAQLTQLQSLFLSGNQLSALPDGLAQLTQLLVLDLSRNQLSALPDGLAQLTQLQSLDLSRNQLSALPDWLAQLTQLRYLDLSRNQLSALPDWLAQLTHLQSLGISGNPLSPDLAEAAEQGTERLLAYLRELAQDPAVLWQAKVMLVGEGEHGKTSLLRALKGEPFIENHLATPLLDVSDLPMRHPYLDVELELRAWDFGGQDFYFATQQFFFTGKSIFLLVWNPRGNFHRATIQDWLDRIYALAPDAPVFLVATHGEKHEPNVPLSQLKEEYGNVQGDVFSVDSKTGKNIAKLREAIRQAAAGLEHMGSRRPGSWVRATRAVHEHPQSYLPVGEFREFVRNQGVLEVNTFLAHLSLCGEITYFSRNPIYHPETAELNDWVILKPAWLLQRISDVLTDKAVRQSAVFRRKDLERIWPGLPGYVREFLARLMDHFDLAYPVDDDHGRHIVVELSAEDRPAEVAPRWREWTGEEKHEKVALHYKFPIAIPPGLPTWFTARAHRYTTPAQHWRRGALLTDGVGNAALIETELDQKTVRLEARGPIPLDFFTKLRICFEDTVNRFPGLRQRLREFVPCVGANCPGFDRRTLELNRADGETEIRCQDSACRRKHKIETLLYGLRPPAGQRSLEEVLDLARSLQQEFNLLTKREQSRPYSRCPSLFTLEYERLGGLLPSVTEGWRDALIDRPLPVRLTLWCQHPEGLHEVKSYRIQPPGRRLAELAPLMKEAHKIIGATLPLAGVKAANLKDLAEGWVDRVSEPLGLLNESAEEPTRAYGVALVALRQILMECAPEEADRWGGLRQVLRLKSQYLWVCEEHAGHPDYQ
jgi:GTPase SAR1 family protein